MTDALPEGKRECDEVVERTKITQLTSHHLKNMALIRMAVQMPTKRHP
jgi:hypothetical protein